MKYGTFIVFNDDKISRNFFQNFKKDNVLLIKENSFFNKIGYLFAYIFTFLFITLYLLVLIWTKFIKK